MFLLHVSIRCLHMFKIQACEIIKRQYIAGFAFCVVMLLESTHNMAEQLMLPHGDILTMSNIASLVSQHTFKTNKKH